MADTEPTLGEIDRRLDRFEKAVRDSLKAIDDRMANHVVTRIEYDIKHKTVVDRVKALEDERTRRSTRWWALVIGVAASVAGDIVAVLVAVNR